MTALTDINVSWVLPRSIDELIDEIDAILTVNVNFVFFEFLSCMLIIYQWEYWNNFLCNYHWLEPVVKIQNLLKYY